MWVSNSLERTHYHRKEMVQEVSSAHFKGIAWYSSPIVKELVGYWATQRKVVWGKCHLKV